MAAAVVVVVAGGVTAAVLSSGSSGRTHHVAVPPRSVSSATTAPPVATTVPTTAPGDTVSLVSAVNGVATYRVAGTGRLQVVATGPCWVEIRRGGATGEVTYSGVLAAGQSHGLARFSWIRIGDPAAVTIEAGTTRVDPPGSAGQPMDLQFG